MDLNKKYLLHIIAFFLLSNLNAWGQALNISGKIYHQSTLESVEYANVTLQIQDSVFLKGMTVDSIGRFEFTNLTPDDYVLSVSCMGFESKKILLQNLSESIDIDVSLNESTFLLNDVIISASSTIGKINQRIVFPTKLQLDHSANGMQLLNTMMLPGLNINPIANIVSSSDGRKVILKINGVSVNPEEIQTLQPHQIKRIEYLDYTGIRHSEASKIVNYIITRDDKGGVVGVDLMNSLNIIAGGDVFFAKFNKGKSEYALNYTTAFQKINSNSRIRSGSYLFESSPILERNEIGNGGDYSYQMHDVTLGYNYQQSDSTFLNARLKYALTNQPNNDFKSRLKENGIDVGQIFDANSQKLNTPTIDLYYEHGLKNRQRIYTNIVGSFAKTKSRRNYIEYDDTDTHFEEQFILNADKYSLIAESIYEKGFKYGNLKLGAKHIQSYTKQVAQQDGVFKSGLNQSESSVFGEWSHSNNHINYSLGLRFNHIHFSSNSIKRGYYNILPKAMFGCRLNESSFIRYDVETSQTNPTLLELTDTEVRINPYLAEKGNLSLKPYLNLNNNLFYENQKGLFTVNMNLRHHYKHQPIMESVKKKNDYFLTTPENMKTWSKYNAEISLKVGMIYNILQFSFTGGYNHFSSIGYNYSHKHSNFYYSASVLAMYKKWMFVGQIQPFEEELYGESVTKKSNYHYLAIQYNSNNFSFGLGAFNPFKNISQTIIENRNSKAPFRWESFSKASQTIVATLTWNFNFGKAYSSGSKSLNKDADYGIKDSYK